MKINISVPEYKLLSEDPRFKSVAGLYKFSKKADGLWTMEISEADADRLRDFCGDMLAVSGFDEKYKANEKGQILENLVDKLFA